MRRIDESKPLSGDDRQWLLANNQHALVERIDREQGVSPSAATSAQPSQADKDLQRLQVFLDENFNGVQGVEGVIRLIEDRLFDSTSPEAPDDSDEVPNDKDEDQDTLFEGEDGDQEDYAAWTNDALRAELGRRELSKSGTKDEMVERLESDDEG